MSKKPSSKKITGYINLQVPAGQAKPASLGSVLGQRKVNIVEFCRTFNDQTASIEAGTPIPVVVTVYDGGAFTFITKLPPVSFFLKKAAGISKGSVSPGISSVGSVTMDQVKEIALKKMQYLGTFSLESAMNLVVGSARSMGLDVK